MLCNIRIRTVSLSSSLISYPGMYFPFPNNLTKVL
uniref:Uncharacterized protein n=1 Tax=Anguilla anguilla TaxID=7936 RepID=A0A0E9UB32_ANGAN